MDNATRAARLAEIFGWEHAGQFTWVPWIAGQFDPDELFAEIYSGMMLGYMLRELPKRGYSPVMDHQWREGGWVYVWSIFQKGVGRKADVCDDDCLIALVDAVIAAHAERQAT